MKKLAARFYLVVLRWHVRRYPQGGSLWLPLWMQSDVMAELAKSKCLF